MVTAGKGGVNVDGGFTIEAGTIQFTSNGGAISFDTTTGVGVGLGMPSSSPAVVSGSGITLQGSTGIALAAADVSATTTLDLITSGGGIVSTGTLAAGELIASAGTGVSLTGNNTLTTIGGISSASGNIVIDSTAITIADTIEATGGTVTLAANRGSISETGAGLIDSAALLATAVTGINLNAADNNVGTLAGAGSTGGNIVFDDMTALSVVGSVTANAGNIDLSAPGLAISNIITASSTGTIPGGTVSLTASAGDIIESGAGAIEALVLTGGATKGSGGPGQALLASSNNAVGTLDAFSTGGNLVLVDKLALVVQGLVEAAAGTLSLATPDLTVAQAASLSAPGGLIVLQSNDFTLGGSVTTGATGTIAVDLLTPGALTVGGSGLQVGEFETALLALGSLNGTSVSGDVTGIKLDGAIDFGSNVATLGLFATGAVTGSSGVTVSTLVGNAGTLGLTGGNSITTLGSFTAASNFLLDDQSALTVAGPLNGNTVSLTAAKTIDITGEIIAIASATLVSTGGNIIETGGGVMSSPDLTVTASAGTVDLTGANSIGTLVASSAGTNFALADQADLTIDQGITVGTGGTLALTAPALTLLSSGSLSAPGGTILLRSNSLDLKDLVTTGSTGLIAVDLLNAGTLTLGGSAQITHFDTDLLAFGSLDGSDASGDVIAIRFDGPLPVGSHAATLALFATDTITGSSGVTAGVLTGSAGTTFDLTGANDIATLGAFSASDFVLADQSALNVAGPLASATTSLTAASLDISGGIAATSLYLAATSGSMTETGAGSIDTGSLSGSASAGVSLTSTTNIIVTLGKFNAADFTLLDQSTLTVAGQLTSATTSLTAAALAITGSIDASTSLALTATDGSIAGTGSIVTTLLTGNASVDVSLTGTNNTIGTLGNFTASSFTLDDLSSLTVAGALTSPIASLSAASLDITGSIGAATSLFLAATSGGSMIETGSITTGTLSGNAGTVVLTGSNTIGTLGNFNAADFTLDDQSALIVAGTLTSPIATLTAASLAITGSIDAGTSLFLASTSGDITETLNGVTGSMSTSSLSGSASLDALLNGSGNMVVSLGDFTAGNFSLNDQIGLTVAGSLSSATASLTAASMDINGAIGGANGASTSLFLAATNGGSISETGSINTGVLTGNAGTVVLTGSNTIPTLGSFTASDFTLVDQAALTVAGPLVSPIASLAAPSLAITGGIDAAASLDLEASNFITETLNGLTGSIIAGTLTGNAGTVALTGSNSIGTLGNFTAADFILDDQSGLVVAGTLTSPAASLTASSLAIPGSIDAATSLFLAATGGVAGVASETGSITTSLLTGTVTAGASLTGSNSIVTLGSFTALGFSLADQIALNVAGPLTSPNASLTASALNISGSIDASNSLFLAATDGGITEPGSINAGSLTGTATGSAVLTGSNTGSNTGGNLVATLGDFTADGFTLFDGQDLTVAGNVNGMSSAYINTTGNLTITGSVVSNATTLTGASLIISGNSTGNQILELIVTAGGIGQAAATGGISAALLIAKAPGDIDLLNPHNDIDALGDVSAANFTLNNMPSLLVEGTILAESVTVRDGGAITESGSITTSLLDGSAAGSAALLGSNSIGTLGSFTAGEFALIDQSALDVDGPLTSPSASLTATSLNISGTIDATSSLFLAATDGGITESGSITAGTLAGLATGSATIGGTMNQIDTLAAFTASGFVLNDAASLLVTGPVQGGASVAIADLGSLSVPGTITGGTVALGASSIGGTGAIDASGLVTLSATAGGIDFSGAISTALLDGTATGNVTLDGANQISALGNFSAASFTLDDLAGLSVDGKVTAGNTSLAAASLQIPGVVFASNSLSLTAAAGDITETGVIDTANLSGSATGSAQFSGTNTIAALGNFAATDFLLDDAAALAVTGTLTAASSASITATQIGISGQIDANTSLALDAKVGSIVGTGTIMTSALSLDAATSASLTGANQIAALDAATTQGNLNLFDTVSLLVSGSVTASAGSVSLTATNLTVASDVTAAGNIDLDASTGTLAQTSGMIDAGSATSMITLNAVDMVDLAGTLSAQTIMIGDASLPSQAPRQVVWDGNTIDTGSDVPPNAQKPQFPNDTGAARGVFVVADDFTQTGLTRINGLGHGATIDITLARGSGAVRFDHSFGAGLIAPGAQLFLTLNAGTASGHIDVAGLSVRYTRPGATILSDLDGTIGGLGGQSAAGRGYIAPQPDANYRFNSCAIESVNCVLLSPIIVPIFNPTGDLVVETSHKRSDDDDLIIPNVGDEDF